MDSAVSHDIRKLADEFPEDATPLVACVMWLRADKAGVVTDPNVQSTFSVNKAVIENKQLAKELLDAMEVEIEKKRVELGL